MTPAQRSAAQQHHRASVRARGPLPALRTGVMPYGVLPCGRFDDWLAAPTDPDRAFEQDLHRLLADLLPLWRSGTDRVAKSGRGDPEAALVGMLGLNASSVSYGVRTLLGELVWWNLGPGGGHPPAPTDNRWHDHIDAGDLAVADAGFPGADPPLKGMVFVGPRFTWRAPLVQSAPLSASQPLAFDYLTLIRNASHEQIQREDYGVPLPEKPLLYTLARHAALRTYVGTATKILHKRGLGGDEAIDEELLDISDTTIPARRARPLERLEVHLPDLTGTISLGDWLSQPTVPAGPDTQDVLTFNAALEHLAATPSAELELLLAETIDTASHRLDAWITSLSTKRLAVMRAQRPGGILLGAYGWLEDVRPSARGPGSGGYLLAPSVDQAAAAAVLENGYLTHMATGSGDAFAVALSSARARRARQYLQGVREGLPLGELLGQRFESDLHAAHALDRTLELDRYIAVFRRLYPLGTAADSAGSGSPTGVFVHGVQLLAAARAGNIPFGTDPDLPAPGATDHAALQRLVDGLADDEDAVADLLLSESVFQAVRGNTARAGHSLDAAAGIAAPPDPQVLQTPNTGVTVTHRVGIAVPAGANAPLGWADTPRSRAHPALNTWAGALLGDPHGIRMTVEITPSGGTTPITKEISVADLELGALDLLALDAPTLDGEVLDDAGWFADWVRAVCLDGQPAGSALVVRLGRLPHWPLEVRALGEVAALISRLRAILAAGRPLRPADLAQPHESVEPDDGLDTGDLAARALAVRAMLSDTVVALDTALGALGNDQQLAAAALGASLFGTATTGTAAAPDIQLILAARLQAVDDALADGDPATALGRAFEPGLPVAAILTPPVGVAASLANPSLLGGSPLGPLRWLQQNARVRPVLGDLEISLLIHEVAGGGPPALHVAQLPHAAGDHWLGLPLSPGEPAARGRLSLVLHTPGGTGPGDSFSGLLLDELVERIPDQTMTAGVTFQFDRPNSRAPQAWLLAVPPTLAPGERWTWDRIAGCIESAFDLAMIRTVDSEALGALGQFLPAIALAYNSERRTVTTDLLAGTEAVMRP